MAVAWIDRRVFTGFKIIADYYQKDDIEISVSEISVSSIIAFYS